MFFRSQVQPLCLWHYFKPMLHIHCASSGGLKFSWLTCRLPHFHANPVLPMKHHGTVTCVKTNEHKSPCNTIHRSSWRLHTLLRVWVVHLAERMTLPWPFNCPCFWPAPVSHLIRLNQHMHRWAEKSSLGIDALCSALSLLPFFSCRHEGRVFVTTVDMH